MAQEMTQPQICYNLGRYVSIWHSDGNGNPTGPYIKSAIIPRRIVLNRPLVIREVSYLPDRTIDLGIVREGRGYRKKEHVEIRTDSGWYYVKWNMGLEINRTDTFHWCEL